MSKDWESIPEDLAHTESFVAGGIRWVRESAMYQAMEDVADGFGKGVIAEYRRDKEALTAALAEAKEAKDSKWCWRIGNALGIVNPSIESAELAITNLWDEIKKLKMERVLGVEVPSPNVKSAEALRFAADVVAATSLGGLPEHVYCSADDLRVLADERDAKTAQDHAIEQAAQAMYEGYNRGSDWAKASAASHDLYRRHARDLADKGLLNTKHGEAAADIPTPSLGEIFDFNSVPDKYCGCDKWMISEPCGHAGGEA